MQTGQRLWKHACCAGALCLFVLWFFAVPLFAAKPPLFEPADLETCDGVSWSGITFGTTTQDDIWRMCRASTKVPYKCAIELLRPKGETTRYYALLCGNKRIAPVGALLIVHEQEGILLETLSETLKEQPQFCYMPARKDNWWMAVYRERGITALVVGGMATVLLLTKAEYPNHCLQMLSTTETRVEPVIDEHAGEPKIVEFGNVSTNFRLSRVGLKDGEQGRLEDSMRSMTAGGRMRYRSGTSGCLSADISAEYSVDRGGSVSVLFTLEGQCPYGPIKARGAKYYGLPKGDPALANASAWYTAALFEARMDLENDLSRVLALQGPEKPETIRARQWSELLTLQRKLIDTELTETPETAK